MKVITAALVCLLLAGAWLQDVDAKSMHVPSSKCCFTLVERKMSLQSIQCYKNTSSTCSYKNHLILKLNGGLEACVSQTKSWVRAYLKRINPCQ
ncbi:C-C motif chemokine 1 [Orcinus orca]|uniref:C-C motif chemokine 1 n=1 Tax=Orcinus orca TaxID=9733 RepID=UPI002112EAAE|nr:C-C motif chemokine 1 [Orcinus orca]XP_049558309.1 C-C motif chemokine 1 [Orcinus orca]XP_059854215.1 C-C motif chemokine 1-like [Delphinus delphis]XP_059990586.1 C-C motif chemokine 1 [Lagenorhynchus albirostris]XP_059990587.1 C-C motif chemokine 1 [Lagenorhynchus albirostris]XP_059990588.1 C-C motif chemokine 1 [Lagenorhynchus albirostris]